VIAEVDAYLALRRALGYSLSHIGKILQQFARFADRRGERFIRVRSALAFARRSRSPERRELVLRKVVLLAQHLHAEDPRHEVPAIRVFAGDPYRRAVPYIFTPRQVSSLVDEAFRLKATYPLRPFTFGTLFALLAATGLRISEALALQFQDVTPDGLVIRNTKFYKSRLVPLHDSVLAGLGRYLRLRRRLPGDHVFAASSGEPLTYGCVKLVFAKLLKATGIARRADGPRPRLHCLRHTFAVRVLERCPSGREQITKHQLALTTYLGHASLESTFWYHEATPQLLRRIARASEAYARGNAT